MPDTSSTTREYATIVADPPWPLPETGRSLGANDRRGRSGKGDPVRNALPYAWMTVSDIMALPVIDLSVESAHLYLWTTQRFLEDSFAIANAWGFREPSTLVWCKKPMGFLGGVYHGHSVEFLQFATRGEQCHKKRVGRQWFEWPRGRHSEKPAAFYDMVEQVSPGPYLDLFARRQRLGWDTWGNEALAHVELAS